MGPGLGVYLGTPHMLGHQSPMSPCVPECHHQSGLPVIRLENGNDSSGTKQCSLLLSLVTVDNSGGGNNGLVYEGEQARGWMLMDAIGPYHDAQLGQRAKREPRSRNLRIESNLWLGCGRAAEAGDTACICSVPGNPRWF